MFATVTEVTLTGLFAVIVAGISVFGNWLTRRRVEALHQEVRTNDGKRAGDYIEETAKEVARASVAAMLAKTVAEAAALEMHKHDARDRAAFSYLGVPEDVYARDA